MALGTRVLFKSISRYCFKNTSNESYLGYIFKIIANVLISNASRLKRQLGILMLFEELRQRFNLRPRGLPRVLIG